MLNSESTELIRIEKLIDQGKHEEALKIMENFEGKEEYTPQDIASCHLLKCELFFQQGLYKDVVKLAEQTYKESLGLGKNFLSVDALLMFASGLISLRKSEKAYDILKQGEDLLKSLARKLPKDYQKRKASFDYEKGRYYELNFDFDLAIEHLELSLELNKEFGAPQEIIKSYCQLGWILGVCKGELDRALEYAKNGLMLAKENNMKCHIAKALSVKGCIYGLKGDINRTISTFEKSLKIFKELNNKERMAATLNNLGEPYRKKGEFDRALECSEQSIELNNEIGDIKAKAVAHDFLIQILIEKGDLERAQQSLRNLEQLNKQLNDKYIDKLCLLDKALILKASTQTQDLAKAEEILKQLIEDEDVTYEWTSITLLNLCGLLISKLSKTNNLKILDEILIYVNQIMNFARNSRSYWLLAESYLLEAKLKLITFEIEETQQLLTQAKYITEKYGLNLLSNHIKVEQKELKNKMNRWNEMKKSKVNLATRIELAGLEEQIRRLLKKRMSLQKTP